MSIPVIAVTNQSTVLSDAEVQATIPALQHQVSNDFLEYWGADCTLSFLDKSQPLPAGWWQIVVCDDSDQAGALGYHDFASNGMPIGKVFAKTDIDSGSSWTVTFSHELTEMLADPWIDTAKQAANGTIYALEVADAVEADDLGYKIGDVLVSDFVTPKWFNDSVGIDRYSFKKNISKSHELAPGGYISFIDKNGHWTQINADKQVGTVFAATAPPPIGSRRHRRTIPSDQRKLSTR